MKGIREICVAGKTIEVTCKIPVAGNYGKKRTEKKNPTPEDVKKVNDRNAEKTLRRILNHNFAKGDWHLVLTYSGQEPKPEQAKKDKEKFLEKLRNEFRKKEKVLKWVAVTEYQHARIHHHIICSQIDYEILVKCWPHGDIRPTPLKDQGNYKRLAAYLIKETTKTFRLPNSINKRRFTCSRTIVRPEVKKEYINLREFDKEIKPLKGYYIDQDTVRRGEHEVTGYPYLEYTMISLTEDPRLKKWKKGKVVKRVESYNYILRGMVIEEQVSLIL